ncbi:hypothetical protein [Microvirga brassicacearum]|uniref:hypothetical protein n=1 Tax=Microvirga brassicacearum TaxID=2580413 RepID=UPI0019149C18|nr:hypothetical protein [Microvirga brassicacearum]
MGWFNGPPYAVAETVFDEDDLEACEPVDPMDLNDSVGPIDVSLARFIVSPQLVGLAGPCLSASERGGTGDSCHRVGEVPLQGWNRSTHRGGHAAVIVRMTRWGRKIVLTACLLALTGPPARAQVAPLAFKECLVLAAANQKLLNGIGPFRDATANLDLRPLIARSNNEVYRAFKNLEKARGELAAALELTVRASEQLKAALEQCTSKIPCPTFSISGFPQRGRC